MMLVLIVDDEPLARLRLKRLLEGMPVVTQVIEAQDGEQAVAHTFEYDPDIVLMDIRMPEKDGLSAARQISHLDDPPALIFCTAYDQYALEAFETLAVGYLLKPVSEEKLFAAIEKAAKTNKMQRSMVTGAASLSEHRQYVVSTTHKGTELIPLTSIHCFVADNKYITVMHEKGESIIDETLKELGLEFGERFVRVHRNALVAVHAIKGLDKKSDGQTVIQLKSCAFSPQVSRRHLAHLKALLNTL